MLYRLVAVLFLAGTAATLAAQSNLSFETCFDDNYSASGNVVLAGDFNNSGKPGLIECCNSDNQLVFQAGNGDGTFQPPVVAYSTPVSVLSMVATDVNGDGKLDLVAVAIQNPPAPPASPGEYYLLVWLGNGDGTFQAPQTYPTLAAPNAVVTGNFFNDGHPDIAVGENGNIDVFRNDGNGTFTVTLTMTMTGGSGVPTQFTAGDLNGNGLTDIVTSNVVYWNQGNGSFSRQSLPQESAGPYLQVVVARLNGDAMMDILAAYVCGNYCVGFDAFYGQGNDTLYERNLVTWNGVNPTSITGVGDEQNDAEIAGADVNGDGYGDIVAFGTSCSSSDTGGCSELPGGLFVWLGNADGSFQQTPQVFHTADAGPGPLAMADFNRDGRMDFVNGGEAYLNATTRTACGTYAISPTVTVCEPVDNTYSPSPVSVDANGYDTTPMTAMQEYIDGSLEYSKPVTSFDTTFPVSDGAHLSVTKGWDASGRSFVADRTVNVYSGSPGPVCPAVTDSASICLPSAASSTSPVLILANGDVGDSIPTAAQLYIDGALVVNNQAQCAPSVCWDADSYVQTTQTLSAGDHDLVFKIWAQDGNVYEASKTITVN
jgi:FG-GAP-like repeat